MERLPGNKWFPDPDPNLTEVEAATDDLFEAETRTLTRVVDSVTERKAGGPRGRTFHAKQTRLNEIEVFAPSAGRGAAYEFQYSLDGGRTWLATRQQIMNIASVTIPGPPSHSMVHLRDRVIAKNVTGDWSQTIAIMVE